VAIATGMSPLGLGNDVGGSLRNPANACGIVSIRPSAGRVPSAGRIPNEDNILAMQLMNVQGPMARNVADAQLALEVLMGAHPRDPASTDAPFAGRALKRPLKIAVVARPPGVAVDPAVADAVTHAADALANAGYDVVDALPPRYEEAVEMWTQFIVVDFMSEADSLGPLLGPAARSYFDSFVHSTTLFSDVAEMSKLLMRRHGLARDWSLFMDEHPIVLTPTWTQLPFKVGFDVAPESGAGEIVDIIRPVVLANLLGLPSVCVPSRRDPATGLPVGVLLNGQRFREDLCLEAAQVIEMNSDVKTPINPLF
jgi:amidase